MSQIRNSIAPRTSYAGKRNSNVTNFMSIGLNSRGSILYQDKNLNYDKNRMKSSNGFKTKVEILNPKKEKYNIEDQYETIL